MGIHEQMHNAVYDCVGFYELGQKDYQHTKYLPPAGPIADPAVRAYQDGWECADRLRTVSADDIIGGRVPDCLVKDCVHLDLIDRATGEGRR